MESHTTSERLRRAKSRDRERIRAERDGGLAETKPELRNETEQNRSGD